jgi:hypothetical protein
LLHRIHHSPTVCRTSGHRRRSAASNPPHDAIVDRLDGGMPTSGSMAAPLPRAHLRVAAAQLWPRCAHFIDLRRAFPLRPPLLSLSFLSLAVDEETKMGARVSGGVRPCCFAPPKYSCDCWIEMNGARQSSPDPAHVGAGIHGPSLDWDMLSQHGVGQTSFRIRAAEYLVLNGIQPKWVDLLPAQSTHHAMVSATRHRSSCFQWLGQNSFEFFNQDLFCFPILLFRSTGEIK